MLLSKPNLISKWKEKIKRGTLLLASLGMLNGCATYLGYNLHHDVKILDTKYIDGIPNKKDRTNLKHLYVKVQIKKLREDVERPYNVGDKLLEMVVGAPLFGLISPFEFLARLAGSPNDDYAENPPSYFTSLSQSWLIGLINPFQCMSTPPRKQTHLKTLEEKMEWKRADIALLELEGLLPKEGSESIISELERQSKLAGLSKEGSESIIRSAIKIIYEKEEEYEKALSMMITKTKGEFIIPKTITSEELEELNKLQDYSYESENFLNQTEEFKKTKVISALEEILQKEPNNIDARLSLASVYESNNLEDKAIKEYHKVVELAPENAYAHFALGNIYKNESDQYMTINKAEEEWKKAIEHDPNFVDAHHNLAVSYYEKKEYSKALEEWEIVKKLNPNYPNIDKNLDLIKKKRE